jgi:hypothetical protein
MRRRALLAALAAVAALTLVEPARATLYASTFDGSLKLVRLDRNTLRPLIRHSLPVEEGRLYRFSWDLQPDDYVFEAGHRIGLVVVSTDHDYTIRPAPGTRLSLRPALSWVRLPVVGARGALGL